ncbi:DsbA family protein [Rhizobium laguerreae]|uniref:DsbA family protein n=1 Tax=Rhizobium laguerreae TaxID=1076926 RepID=UPI001389C7F4|nr:DsbA family protein [Rhizobium laguerreae]NDK52789.1 DsbA family protein [Rhizobium laguerreae]
MTADIPNDPTAASSGAEPAKPARSLRPWVFGSFVLAAISAVFSIMALLFAAGILPPLSDSADHESQIRAYLLANPQVIVQSVNDMEARRQAAADNELAAAITHRHDEIFNDPSSPLGANPKGGANLVEFFDYNCPYCRQAAPVLDSLEQEDKGLRLVFKEYPILGAGSVFAAHAALASQKQGKYLAFHKAMMAYRGRITEASSLEVAADVGLDVEQLKKDMQDPTIDETIRRNLALAQDLRIAGTPSFVAGKEIVQGLADAGAMKRLIASAHGR